MKKFKNDLCEYDMLPQNIKDILDNFDTNSDIYRECERIKNELQDIGWTCDYGLDGVIYDIVKL